MQQLPSAISDLALILGTASLVILLFKKLNQPLVLGYLLAGFLVGPQLDLFPSISHTEGVHLWADIGVIFLLFALGLEFSFKKLISVGGSASFSAIFEVLLMTMIGFGTGKVLKWNMIDSLFLGGLISISSTSIVVRTLDELGYKSKKFVGILLGILVIEDLVAVLMLVLLTTVAVTQRFAGFEMIYSSLKLAFFLCLWFVAGIFILPGFLKRAQNILNEETILVLAVGLCLLMVQLASQAGFSAALGAFITGSVLAETVEGERIHHLITPLKNLFSAVFFISVGMLIDPEILVNHWDVILLLSLVVIFGKTFAVTTGAVLSGQSLRTALQTGMSLSQIGEFSFIIATVGVNLKVVRQELYPVAVAVSVVTAFTTPYMMKSTGSAYRMLEKLLPAKVIKILDEYSMISFNMASSKEWRASLKSFILRIVLNSIIVIAIFLLVEKIFFPFLMANRIEENISKLIALTMTILLSSPFLWALAFGRSKSFEVLFSSQSKNGHDVVFIVSRVFLVVCLIAVMVGQFISAWWGVVLVLMTLSLLVYLSGRRLRKIYQWVENHFLTNLDGVEPKVQALKYSQTLVPWEGHMTEFVVPAEAGYVGHPLTDLGIRELFGVTIALIERGRKRIPAPGGQESFMPNDKIFAIGTDEQLARFRGFIESVDIASNISAEDRTAYSLEQHRLKAQSDFVGKNILECGIREKTQGLVVGIEREGLRILNPHSTEVLKEGDLLWIVGDRKKIFALR